MNFRTITKWLYIIRIRGAILGTYYLLTNNTITTSSNNANRLLPVQTKYVAFEEDKGYSSRKSLQ
ncbi:MAG: hypothetical protein ACOX2Y_03000 [Christensenellales bacterium]